MAKQRFSVALNAASFPLVSVLQQRTVMQGPLDNNIKNARAFYGTEESANYNVAQLFFCENILPTAEGIQSVGYKPIIAGLAGVTGFDQAITLRDANENVILMSPAKGLNYFYNAATGIWESKTPLSAGNKLVTRAYVNGRTFVCYEGLGIYEYDTATSTYLKRTITGLTDAQIKGIGASSNYMLAFTANLEVHWSSLIDPLDFIESLSTGAGYAIPQDLKGSITAILGISGGYIIYTVKNAVAATYTNNVRAPWSFKEVPDAGGVQSYEQVTSEQTAGPQYAWTTSGLQKITLQGATAVSAEINDFIAGKMWEDWSWDNMAPLVKYDSRDEFPVKVTYIASRWLIISYATTSTLFNYAIVYDVILKRYGRLKVDHVDCFTYPNPSIVGPLKYSDLIATTYNDLSNTTYADLDIGLVSDPSSKSTVAFMTANGSVSLLDMTYNKDVQHDALFMLGKYQFVRAKNLILQMMSWEGVYLSQGETTFRCWAVSTFDGETEFHVQEMKQLQGSGRTVKFGAGRTIEGLNISLIVSGTFALKTGVMEATLGGSN